MRRLIVGNVLFLMVILLSGCFHQEKEIKEYYSLTEYSLDDLQDTFEMLDYNSSFGMENEPVFVYRDVLFNDIIDRFDSFIMRELPYSDSTFIYSVYRVNEGGCYYVRWLPNEQGALECIDQIYLNKLAPECEIKTVKRGDPYTKLESIDKSNKFVMRLGLNPIAYSLTSEGKVYGFELGLNEFGNYEIINIRDCSNSQVFLAMILQKDYP